MFKLEIYFKENIGWECWNAAGTLLSLLYFSYYPKQQCLTMVKAKE